MATKFAEAITCLLADCPYVISLHDLITKTRLEMVSYADAFVDGIILLITYFT
jgi:hypothetical protein